MKTDGAYILPWANRPPPRLRAPECVPKSCCPLLLSGFSGRAFKKLSDEPQKSPIRVWAGKKKIVWAPRSGQQLSWTRCKAIINVCTWVGEQTHEKTGLREREHPWLQPGNDECDIFTIEVINIKETAKSRGVWSAYFWGLRTGWRTPWLRLIDRTEVVMQAFAGSDLRATNSTVRSATFNRTTKTFEKFTGSSAVYLSALHGPTFGSTSRN